ncbi:MULTISPECIES: NAD-glutamate dehydrogenase [unclassified Chelatococcus]|uniref:NAD-glutamate dehydrogenase n=1 Tax=unclassified Chelatococcus TaxID=2638111 RepID=UPI001BCFBDA8|nr:MULTISPECIES: NAD-glutamate dehydrogenase [unclassified Chelatococcus]MBS7696813.1 NAD-glutamate dehydrogenase [Chelatococcus sp. YT9]MBX3558349.1 NAD-glutamate dehydrogenase [Chelatococcus sp.]
MPSAKPDRVKPHNHERADASGTSPETPDQQGIRSYEEVSGGEADRQKVHLIASVETVLRQRVPTVPPGFVAKLFGATATEDLERYAVDEIAALTADAFAHLAEPRRRGHPPAVKLIDRDINGDGQQRQITLLEVVNDNMAFLLDSTLAALIAQGFEAELALVAHPIIAVERDTDGRLTRIIPDAEADRSVARESLIHIHLDRIDDEAVRTALVGELARTYAEVRQATDDWSAMRDRLRGATDVVRSSPASMPAEAVEEAGDFLSWLADGNFTILGIREYSFSGGDTSADPVEGSGLGILRDPSVRILRRGREMVVMTPEMRAFLAEPVPLIVTKANVKSRVHRRAYLDYIGVKLFSMDGRLDGELRIVGLFTADAYTGTTRDVPYLRHKVAQVIARAGFDPASYSGRALLYVLEDYPRDELFQVDVETLYRYCLEILKLTERPRVRVLARRDAFDRFVSVLVYIPKDRYDTEVRRRVGEFLARTFDGHVSAAYPAYPEGPLSRTHFIIGHHEGKIPAIGQEALEAGVRAIVRTWRDALGELLEAAIGGRRGRVLAERYGDAFGAAYREFYSGEAVLTDINILEQLSVERPWAVDIYRRQGEDDTSANLKVFSRGRPMPLSERVPLLENLGFRVVNERTHRIFPAGVNDDARVWLHDMRLERAAGGVIDVDALQPAIEAALMALFRDLAESDGFNALVLEAGLGWRDVSLLRSLAIYLRQIGVHFSIGYLAGAVTRHATIATEIVALFYARFDPRLDEATRSARQAEIHTRVEALLQGVASLDDDRILRRFVNLVDAAIRTNFFQVDKDGNPRRTIAIKYACARVDGLPMPKPLYEIFVHSPRVDGVHMRFGKVARGGLRWSDRAQDFRTEVLGLVKAQQVKNAVIVPVGAKGGFLPKRLPAPGDRQAFMAEGAEAYRIFVSSMLDITDNREGEAIVHPPLTVRYDDDDPYLVVAADKGTATFSDLANSISADHGFWLGDAFASGGSHGYDHKKMGITARGGWEAVKRHFRELDIDIQTTPVTVAGVGDMSGDVFGNGMLLSEKLKLVAAFDHRDIFLDPHPDPAVSYAERQRLFALPRSSWQDYDTTLISTGGGVFSRAAKSIPLSPAVQAAIGLEQDHASPQEVITAILKAPVDLLWFGGIGTYIRASEETDADAGDRNNDAIRITGRSVRAKVIGEGANLGMTQRGRIEAAEAGVRLNTDAIDNSAGVNSSDVEVNIKIALAPPVKEGRLDEAGRDSLLVEMTDEVARLVLTNNYLQTLAISLAERRGTEELGFARRLMRVLEAEGRLDRAVEFLPDDATLAQRQQRGENLTRPEIAVILAYAKLALYDAILESPVPDDPYLAGELMRYMPKPLRERFPDAVTAHRLRREIIATQLANAIINRGGPTIVTRLADETGADAPTIAAAYAAVRDAYGLIELNAGIDALDERIGHSADDINAAMQLDLYAGLQDLLIDGLSWFIRNADFHAEGIQKIVARYRRGIATVEAALPLALSADAREGLEARSVSLEEAGIPAPLARRLAALSELGAAPDIVRISQASDRGADEVAAIHFAVESSFRLRELAAAARELSVTDYYDRLALGRALGGIASAHRRLTSAIVATGAPARDAAAAREAVHRWATARGGEVERIRSTVESIAASGLTLSRLTVAAGLIGDLVKP